MEDVRLFMEFNLDGKISLLYPKQIPEPHIPGAYVLELGILLLVRTLSFFCMMRQLSYIWFYTLSFRYLIVADETFLLSVK